MDAARQLTTRPYLAQDTHSATMRTATVAPPCCSSRRSSMLQLEEELHAAARGGAARTCSGDGSAGTCGGYGDGEVSGARDCCRGIGGGVMKVEKRAGASAAEARESMLTMARLMAGAVKVEPGGSTTGAGVATAGQGVGDCGGGWVGVGVTG
eukprot:scaffold3344_cov138-Isochrysis_galbana.AAC.8